MHARVCVNIYVCVCVCVCRGEQEIWRVLLGQISKGEKKKQNNSHRAKVKSASELTAKPAYDILRWYEMGFGGL